MRTTTLLLTTTLFTLLACDADGDDAGTPPSLESVTLAADGLRVGTAATVGGTLVFTDPDGDLLSAEIELMDPSGATTSVSTPISGVAGTREGTVAIQLSIQPTAPGRHEATFRLLDTEGNASEPETAAFDVLP